MLKIKKLKLVCDPSDKQTVYRKISFEEVTKSLQKVKATDSWSSSLEGITGRSHLNQKLGEVVGSCCSKKLMRYVPQHALLIPALITIYAIILFIRRVTCRMAVFRVK